VIPSFYLGKVEIDLQTIASGPNIFELTVKDVKKLIIQIPKEKRKLF
jgi:hypothetical protein